MASPTLTRRANEMRAAPTPAEEALHQALVARGIPHRRQACVRGFIADFQLRNKVIVEVDGAPHFTPAGRRRDLQRNAVLRRHGYRVLHFPNGKVMTDPETVCLVIIATIAKKPPSKRRR